MEVFQLLFWYVSGSLAYKVLFNPKPGFAWRQLKRLGLITMVILILAVIMVISKHI